MLKLYDPNRQAFVDWTPPITNLQLSEMLLLNILIELQTLSLILKEDSPSQDSVENTRTEVFN